MPLPTDPMLAQQWYLGNPVAGLLDLNVRSVWNPAAGPAYTGFGVRVVVIDSGFDYNHVDLAAPYIETLDRDFRDNDNDAAAVGDNNHGTAVAGIIGADNNSVGVVGVAFDSFLIGFRNQPSDDDRRLSSTRDAIREAVNAPVDADVINISQGLSNDPDTEFGAGRNAALLDAIDQSIGTAVGSGRGGLGATIVKSAGNARLDNYDVNADGQANDTRQVVVAGVEQNGFVTSHPSYGSSYGAPILVSAFATLAQVATTDRTGNAGYNTNPSPGGDYTTTFDGTSAATPMVAGIVALMYEANPDLGWRDVQTILAYSARHVGSAIGGGASNGEGYPWQWNGAVNWNGDGLHFSNDYGYGLVDAHAAVRLAETWSRPAQTSANELVGIMDMLDSNVLLPDGNAQGSTFTGNVPFAEEVERVTVTVSFSTDWLGDLELYVISPSGTVSELINDNAASADFDGTWTFETQAFRGEQAQGQWQVRAVDDGAVNYVQLYDINVRVLGRDNTVDGMYVYTDEYGETVALGQGHGWRWLDVAADGGIDTANFSALSSSTSINYDTGETVIDTRPELSGGGGKDPNLIVIENFIFGDGNDFLVANFANNNVHGWRGNDELHGRDGNDVLDGGVGNDSLYGDDGNDMLYGWEGADTLDGGAGFDTAWYSNISPFYTVTRNGATVTINGPDGLDTLTGIERLQFDNGFISLRTENDFNGDGKSDVLFSQPGTVYASNYEWQLNNRSLISQGAVDLYDKAFTVQIVGDFDGDFKSDVLFQNPATGGVWEWRLDGRTIVSQGAVDVGDPSYHLLGTGDLNGDGKDDVLFRNNAGLVYEWQMNGRVNTPMAVSALDPKWHVQGTGDFNADGKDDILLHYKNASNAADPANGAFVVWQMNGKVIESTLGIERPDQSWQTLGIGDFNGDGIDDLAIRNVSNSGDNGAVWVYLLAGTVTNHGDGSKTLDILAQGAVGIADPATWHLQQVGDLDGDGRDDILYRNDAGFFYSWNMNGTTIASEGLLQGAAQWADPSFTVVKPHWDLV